MFQHTHLPVFIAHSLPHYSAPGKFPYSLLHFPEMKRFQPICYSKKVSKVIVGMSGGVDSSITAFLLKERGFDVKGVSFILWEARSRSDFTSCCSLESTESASKTAQRMGIVHSSIDVRQEFMERVIEPFVDSYSRGLTPNPCILCNKNIKFPFLLREAERTGAEYIATGHYARPSLPDGGNGSPVLRKGIDPGKDQSYVLYVLNQEQLGKLILPLGNYRKNDVKAIARSLMLDAADRQESQEICFIEDRDYASFIEQISPSACEPGPIINQEGKTIGMHRGICRYTVGQRKGLRIAAPDPHYVTRVDAAKNTIQVGTLEETKLREIRVADLNWISAPKGHLFHATAKVRSMMKDKPATIEVKGGEAKVVFDEPQFAPAPGQSAVFYDGDMVLGGGIILPAR
jgi:tRNA-specific 2-thiouridylase